MKGEEKSLFTLNNETLCLVYGFKNKVGPLFEEPTTESKSREGSLEEISSRLLFFFKLLHNDKLIIQVVKSLWSKTTEKIEEDL